MFKRFLAATIFISLISPKFFAQHTPLDRCVRDSLFRVMPHESQVQKATVYLDLAEILKIREPETSFRYILAAFGIAIGEKNDSLKARSRIQMGDYYGERRKFINALEQYLAAQKIYQGIADTTGQVNALLKIGYINCVLKNYQKALGYCQMGMILAQQANSKSMTGRLFDQLGITWQAMGNQEKALSFFNKALLLLRQTDEKKTEFWVRVNIGSLLLEENRDEEALAYYTSLIQETDSTNWDVTGVIYTRIGHIFDKRRDFRNSLKFNRKALHARQCGHASTEINSSLINIAGDFYNLEIPDSGKIYMDSGLTLARRSNRKNLLENGYRHLYTYYLHQGNYKLTLENYTRYSAIKDEINLERNRNNIAILETNRRLQQSQQSGKIIERQHEIQSLNLKYQDNQSLIMKILMHVTGFSMVGFILLLLNIRRVRQKMQKLNIRLSAEITEREATEEQTRERESQYKFLTDNSLDFITHIDQHKNRVYASSASVNVYGYEPDEILAKSPYDLTLPEYHAYSESKHKEMIETRSTRLLTYQARKKDGTVFWVESILNPLFDPVNGAFKGLVGVTRDIQERKTREFEILEGTKQKEILLKEIHHRVKNNFAILVSLINMQMALTKNQELLQSLTNLQLRIRTMALVHEMLYRSHDFEKISFPGYIRSLAAVIAGAYNRRDIELAIDADDALMDIEASIPLGLIINEILNNSYNHAFPGERAGKINIRFHADQLSGMHVLTMADNGIGIPDIENLQNVKSMGLQVVQILCNQIEATLVVVNDPGASFTISFPASAK